MLVGEKGGINAAAYSFCRSRPESTYSSMAWTFFKRNMSWASNWDQFYPRRLWFQSFMFQGFSSSPMRPKQVNQDKFSHPAVMHFRTARKLLNCISGLCMFKLWTGICRRVNRVDGRRPENNKKHHVFDIVRCLLSFLVWGIFRFSVGSAYLSAYLLLVLLLLLGDDRWYIDSFW